jgi:hypothetical protein
MQVVSFLAAWVVISGLLLALWILMCEMARR